MSYRELWNLVQHLPQNSWTQTILRDDPNRQALVNPDQGEHKFGPWTQGDLLMAALIDAVNQVRFAVVRTASSSNDSYPVPDPFPRPGLAVAGRRRPVSEPPELVQAKVLYLNQIRARG